jgi:hypothetical protein
MRVPFTIRLGPTGWSRPSLSREPIRTPAGAWPAKCVVRTGFASPPCPAVRRPPSGRACGLIPGDERIHGVRATVSRTGSIGRSSSLRGRRRTCPGRGVLQSVQAPVASPFATRTPAGRGGNVRQATGGGLRRSHSPGGDGCGGGGGASCALTTEGMTTAEPTGRAVADSRTRRAKRNVRPPNRNRPSIRARRRSARQRLAPPRERPCGRRSGAVLPRDDEVRRGAAARVGGRIGDHDDRAGPHVGEQRNGLLPLVHAGALQG